MRIGLVISVERETGFEPATSTLARLHSTTELLPRSVEAAPGFEPGDGGFADLCLTTWLCRLGVKGKFYLEKNPVSVNEFPG